MPNTSSSSSAKTTTALPSRESRSTSQVKSLQPEDLVDLQIPNSVQISPSGKQVIYALGPPTQAKDSKPVSSIWLASTDTALSARQLTSGLHEDKSPKWSPSEESIAFISNRGDASAVYILPLGGGEPYPLTPAKNKSSISSFAWSPDGKKIAYISADEEDEERKAREEKGHDAIVYGENWEFERLRIVDVTTRETRTLVEKDLHVMEVIWSEDSREVLYSWTALPELDSPFTAGTVLERLDVDTGKGVEICKVRGWAAGLIWRKENGYFGAPTQIEKTNSSTMTYKFSLEKGTVEKKAYGQSNDLENMRLAGKHIYSLVHSGLSDQIMDLDTDEIIYESNHAIDTWDISTATSSPTLVLSKSSIAEPRDIYSYYDGKLTQLSQHGAAIASLKVGTAKPFYCKAGDGTTLDAVFMTPSSKAEASKPLPTFVHVHGGPYGRCNISFDAPGYHWSALAVSAGYAVLAPNYRGGVGHGDKWASAALGGMGTLDYSDVIDLVRAAISEGLVDPSRVLIGGWSQGGFLSYLAVTRDAFTFRAAICGAGVTDWDLITMTSDTPLFEAHLSGKAPWEDGARESQNRSASAVWHMEKIKTPVLILHGEKDLRVPTSQAIAFHRGAVARGLECDMVLYPREGHLVKERSHRLDMLRRVRAFLDKHLN